MAIKKSVKAVKKLNESKPAAVSSTDALLCNINEKIKNRNIFTWKFCFGWLLAFAVAAVGFLLAGLLHSNAVFTIFQFAAVVVFLANLAIGVMALYKSTQDC